MSYSPKSIIMFVLVLSFFSFFPATSVTQSFAQNSERISISVSNSSFVPLTNTDANQVRVGVEYTIEDESIENEMINAVMKVYAPNGSLIRYHVYSKWVYCTRWWWCRSTKDNVS